MCIDDTCIQFPEIDWVAFNKQTEEGNLFRVSDDMLGLAFAFRWVPVRLMQVRSC
jgi:hypothetical protein